MWGTFLPRTSRHRELLEQSCRQSTKHPRARVRRVLLGRRYRQTRDQRQSTQGSCCSYSSGGVISRLGCVCMCAMSYTRVVVHSQTEVHTRSSGRANAAAPSRSASDAVAQAATECIHAAMAARNQRPSTRASTRATVPRSTSATPCVLSSHPLLQRVGVVVKCTPGEPEERRQQPPCMCG